MSGWAKKRPVGRSEFFWGHNSIFYQLECTGGGGKIKSPIRPIFGPLGRLTGKNFLFKGGLMRDGENIFVVLMHTFIFVCVNSDRFASSCLYF